MLLLMRNYHMEIHENCFRIGEQWCKGLVVGMSLVCKKRGQCGSNVLGWPGGQE